MSEAETRHNLTILDYLNEDCWLAVLQYVPVRDVILSERVSRKWQSIMLVYLRHVRIGMTVEHPRFNINEIEHNISWLKLREADCPSFERWCHKLGTAVVATYCDTKQRLEIIGKYCRNLEAAVFIKLPDKYLLDKHYDSFKTLKWICYYEFCEVSDKCVSQYIASAALEDLEIIGNQQLSGQCLSSIQSPHFRYLFIQQCNRLESRHLLSADGLSQLTKLKLLCLPNEIYENIHKLLGKMPNLEHLHIYVLCYNFRDPIKKEHFFGSVCRLSKLQHLGTDLGATDADLAAVLNSCKELRSLLLEKCDDVTGRGVAAACRAAGPRLTALGVSRSQHLTDDDMLHCVQACPNLTDLDIRFCPKLTGVLLEKLRSARRPLRTRTTLRLYANGTRLMCSHSPYDEMLEDETSGNPTILDYLNEDCWQAVLQYVPVRDVILSERVSRKWLSIVQVYLRHVRIGIKVENSHSDMSKFHPDVSWFLLREADCPLFERWCHKMGSNIVAACINSKQRFKIFGENCPKLESAMFVRLSEELQNNRYENYKRLKWLCFSAFCKVSDSCISEYIASCALKDLEIIGSDQLTGECLSSIQSRHLRYLFIQQCKHLALNHLLSADRLSQLTKFKLIDVAEGIYHNIHQLLGMMPKLDHLHIYSLQYAFRQPITNDSFFEAVCRLSGLRHLGTDLTATDKDLELVTRRCKELNSLLLDNCEAVTGRGLRTACRLAGARLTRLGVARSRHVTNDDVVACVDACPNLEVLDVRNCPQLTEALWARARDARRPLCARNALRLYVSGTRLQMIRDFV